ncbi:MAG: polysaccharide pyruvyl transferase family protein [Caulobacterales bacterium]|nr:polysaccharide pyruvyl transferase family protein [Caulobacterales bacterium]
MSGQDGAARLRVGLLWHSFKNGNLGVGALAIGNARIIARAAEAIGREAEFHVLGPDGPCDYRHRCPGRLASHHAAKLSTVVTPFLAGQRALARCDVVFDIGGGDSFTAISGLKRYAMIVGAKFPPLLHRRPLVLSPQTIGPFKGAAKAALARRVMESARLTCSRDGLSTACAKDELGLADVLEVTDVAFELPYDPPAGRRARPAFGLNVSGLLMRGGYSGANQFGLAADYPALARRLIGHVLDRGDYEVHLVGHVFAPPEVSGGAAEDDHLANQELAREFPEVVLAPAFQDPVEAKTYIASLDAFAGSRMHATIAALSSGVPPLGLAYSRKFEGLFDTLDYSANIDLAASSADEAVAALDAFLNARDAHARAAEAARAEAARRIAAYEGAVRDVLASL